MTFLITIFALGLVIFLHELGHMLMAKRAGIGVYEFSVGMGPKVVSRQWGETLYSLRILPLGGFVKLAGLDDDDHHQAPADKNFNSKSIMARFLTISAGSIMNIILGFTIFVLMFTFIGVPRVNNVVKNVLKDSPAQSVGLQSGDIFLEINDHPITLPKRDIINTIHHSAGKPLKILVERQGNEQTLFITPKANDMNPEIGLIGIVLDATITRYNPLKSIQLGAQETYTRVRLVFVSLSMLINGKAGLKDMAGPIGIIQIASFQLHQNFLSFLDIMALISISLGVINLFPLPVLDGGHLVLLLVEAVRKKRLNKKWENAINNIGTAILIALMVIVVINDVINWESRVGLLKSLTQ
ncbi:MAG: RIP metalloprotease RseP [Candidatus Margulisbacteria bacterium]|nr:RIP metalloprotease RseP [Candidatus Margulisiibacteriota bacterium]